MILFTNWLNKFKISIKSILSCKLWNTTHLNTYTLQCTMPPVRRCCCSNPVRWFNDVAQFEQSHIPFGFLLNTVWTVRPTNRIWGKNLIGTWFACCLNTVQATETRHCGNQHINTITTLDMFDMTNCVILWARKWIVSVVSPLYPHWKLITSFDNFCIFWHYLRLLKWELQVKKMKTCSSDMLAMFGCD